MPSRLSSRWVIDGIDIEMPITNIMVVDETSDDIIVTCSRPHEQLNTECPPDKRVITLGGWSKEWDVALRLDIAVDETTYNKALRFLQAIKGN